MKPSDEALIQTIIGSFRLEGIELSEEVIAYMRRVARNEITTDQAIAEIFKQYVQPSEDA